MPDKLITAMELEEIRTALFISVMLMASICDIRTRTIPDFISILLVLASLIPPESDRMIGILTALPLLMAGLTVGGIGGGDIKITGACGMMLGVGRAFTGLTVGLLLMILFHLVRSMVIKNRQKEKRRAYPLAPFLTVGMVLMI